ncbi:hypothetical protein GC089_02545 [Cellulomonas sp. JZ18]|uniref:hypothetical protein n=1 Tax=Cellulomonas sp. JZ18 TaxID=2654191 RepID=UPI0012D39264|nr:hypothetical protein [Cellulomonas sp. JZ18]QGQ18344.1 hypothetical protein GC089_02545 [Cellulomonas sp. JZ18]
MGSVRVRRRGARGRGLRVVVVTVLVATVAACSPGRSAPPPSSEPSSQPSSEPSSGRSPRPLPAGVADALTVEVAQARADRVARVVELRVRNAGAGDVLVQEARLTTATTSAPAVTERGRDVRAGSTRALRATLADPVCPAGGVTTGVDPAPVVELDVVDTTGRAGTVRVLPTDEGDDLRRVHGEDCAAVAVAAGLTLALDATLTTRDGPTGPVADVVLRVRPVPGGPHVRLVGVGATTLLRPAGGYGRWVVDVDSAAPPPDGRVVLPVAPARCDLHAIAEDKRGTVLGVHAVVDGVELPPVSVPAPPALRGALYDFVLAACGGADDARP